jgi:acetyl-CoA C-acetyltransferase
MGMGACEPEYMGLSPVPAVKDLFKRTGLTLDKFDRIEVNEAFASQYFAVEKDLGLKREITNVNGSGIGLGHPVGMTGARLLITAMYELKHSGKKRALCTLCGGAGVSMATAIELI